jgi:hypothetical protein
LAASSVVRYFLRRRWGGVIGAVELVECLGVVAVAAGDELCDVFVGDVGHLVEVFEEEVPLGVVTVVGVSQGVGYSGCEQELVRQDAPRVETPVDRFPEQPDIVDLAVPCDQECGEFDAVAKAP